MKKDELEKHIKHIRLEHKINYCTFSSIEKLYKKWCKNELIQGNSTFILDSVFDYIIRLGEGIILPLSDKEICEILWNACELMYNSQNNYLSKQRVGDFGVLFSLWEFEEQEDLFIKFYRYNYIFNYKSSSFNAAEIFRLKFGTTYDRFAEFGMTIYLLAVGCGDGSSQSFIQYARKVMPFYSDVIDNLSITVDKYRRLSFLCCPSKEYLPQSLKPSFSFPLLLYENDIYIPLPHILPVACSKSLLYRLTDGNKVLRSKFGKEAFESYTKYILEKSNLYDIVSSEKVYKIGKNEFRTPDVLCFKKDYMVAVECKILTPSHKIRFLDDEEINKLKKILVDDLCKLYRSLFINYKNDFCDIPNIERDKRMGYLISLERIDFLHADINNLVADKLKLNDSEITFMNNHIFLVVYMI